MASCPSVHGPSGARQPTGGSTRQRKRHPRGFTSCSVCRGRHVRCDKAKPACRNCIKRGLHCDGAQNVTPYRFVDPSQAPGSVKRQHKALRRETDPAQENTSAPTQNDGVSSSHPSPYKDPTSPILNSVDLQSGIHTSAQSPAMDIETNPTTGDGKPPCQSTLNDEARDLQPHSFSDDPYLIHEAGWYSDCSDIRGDVCRGDENVPPAFVVFIPDPLQKGLEYLKAHTTHLNGILRAFSENRVDGPLALPYALCLVKVLREQAVQHLFVKKLDATIHSLSTRLRGLLSTPLLYTRRGRISRVSLLFGRRVFHKRLPPLRYWPAAWHLVTVSNFVLDDNSTVTLLLDGSNHYKVPDEMWNGSDPLRFDIVDPAAVFGVG
ncbi:hypothetical protein AJ78_07952 [Emergomyces pasteurianus Ep9510]|uniref:Zn(2)-C6 fungal-type domain-containing protein n=1 Tax=Emergomyces pasteurianus Ep9510 TaxID=1447872 RepID=A0A1J9Q7U0_9EURO|nr:hypothetical protein AJ78_07952 [Emergomyces pasteurianus Ep9510]